jgi:hypothetical protein
MIESAPEQERARVLEATLRDFTTIPTENLSREQRYNLALQLIEERRAKFRLLMMLSLLGALLLGSVLIIDRVLSAQDRTGPLTVRVTGPNEMAAAGSIALLASGSNQTLALDERGEARFENISDAAFKDGVTVSARVPGFQTNGDTMLRAVPSGRLVNLTVTPVPTRVFGTVIDERRQPLSGIVLSFQAGAALDTTDTEGNFSVTLPYPPGTQVPVRATRGGVTGLHDQITIPDGAALTLFFAARQ